MMASCVNHSLLKIARLSKGKMWRPGLGSPPTSGPWIPPPEPGFTVSHWKMEQDQEWVGVQRPGLYNMELLKGPSQNLARPGSQAVLAAFPSTTGLESESFEEQVDAEKRFQLKRGSLWGGRAGIAYLWPLVSLSDLASGLPALSLQPGRTAASTPKGAAVSTSTGLQTGPQ